MHSQPSGGIAFSTDPAAVMADDRSAKTIPMPPSYHGFRSSQRDFFEESFFRWRARCDASRRDRARFEAVV